MKSNLKKLQLIIVKEMHQSEAEKAKKKRHA